MPDGQPYEYNYGDFRYDEAEVVHAFFDMMLYVSNWGNRRLIMKFPSKLVALKELQKYEIEVHHDYVTEIKVSKKGKHVLLDMQFSEDESDWIEGEGLLDSLIPLRVQILKGDYRVLYLAWLKLVSLDPELPDDLLEPPLPANLQSLDYALDSFVEFWDIDPDLIMAASAKSPKAAEISDQALIAQLDHLTIEEKDQFLKGLLSNETQAKNALTKRLRDLHLGPQTPQKQQARTLGALQAETARQHQIRLEKEKRAANEAHLKHMARIEKEQAHLWEQVNEHASLKTGKGYERATEILVDLKSYHGFKKSQSVFRHKVDQLMNIFGRSEAFKRRLKGKGLI